MLYNNNLYPPNSRIRVCDMSEGHDLPLRYNGDVVDFHDTIMASGSDISSIFHVFWATDSDKWPIWNKERIKRISDHLKYDFEFEDVEVEVLNLSGIGRPCSEEARWEILIA